MKGKVARVRLNDKVYVAEVRTDFGGPAWAGSWDVKDIVASHLAAGGAFRPIEVLSWLEVPDA